MTQRICSIDGCDKPHYARTWCNPHWQKWRKYGDPLGSADRGPATCSIDGCGEPVAYRAQDWCKSHYMSWYRHGDPLWERSATEPACLIAGCEKVPVARGWCSAHYQKWRVHGDPLWTAPPRKVRVCGFMGCERKHRMHGYCAAHAQQVRKRTRLQAIHPSRGQWKYTLNHSYFDEISDERRAYWLGFITADGCILQRDGRNALIVELKESDSEHLQLLCDDLESDRPVMFGRTCARVSFHSKQLVAALGRLGVGPRKSATVEPWDGPADLMPHYWRGLMDGDGTLSRVKGDRKWCIAIYGSGACVRGFGMWAHSICGSTASPRLGTGSETCWRWGVTGTTKAQELCASLYGDASLSLKRKQVLAEQLLEAQFGSS